MEFDKSIYSVGSEVRSYGPGSSLNSTSLEFDFSTSFENAAPTINKFETDPDKIKVYHSGTHGKQQGILITRHYLRSDSKCIQCQSCGIFFTPVTFLLHSHDQYGKRIPCNAVQLQLDISHPTTADRQKWNDFQQKFHSSIGLATSPVKDINAGGKNSETRRPLSEIGNKIKLNQNFASDNKDNSSNLKRYSSASSIHLINANSSKLDKLLSMSDLRSDKTEEIKNDFKTNFTEDYKPKSRDLSHFAPIIKPIPLATRSTLLKPVKMLDMPRPPSIYTAEINTNKSEMKQTSFSDFKAKHPTKTEQINSNPVQLISQAMGLLLQAKEELEISNGQPQLQGPVSSSAWRKMYEEERSHRMELEARVRTLEREMRYKKY